MSGPILAHAARLGFLNDDGLTAAGSGGSVLPLYERPYDASTGAQQLAHAKQHIVDLRAKIDRLEGDLQVTNTAMAKRGSILDYVRESILRDLLQLVREDARRVEYQKLLLSILDDEKLVAMHRELVDLLNRDEARRTERRIKELEARDVQLRKALAEKEKRILTAEADKFDAQDQEKRAKLAVSKSLAQLGVAKQEKADLEAQIERSAEQYATLEQVNTELQQQLAAAKGQAASAEAALAQLKEQMELAVSNTEAMFKAAGISVAGMMTAVRDLLRCQEQSAAATKGGQYWQQCRDSMLEAVERIRTAARDVTFVDGFRDVVQQMLKALVVEVGFVRHLQAAALDVAEQRKGEAAKFTQSLVPIERELERILSKQLQLDREVAVATERGQATVPLHERALQVLPLFVPAEDACGDVSHPKARSVLSQALAVASAALTATAHAGIHPLDGTGSPSSQQLARSGLRSPPGSPLYGSSGSKVNGTPNDPSAEDKALSRVLEELKAMQAAAEDEARRVDGTVDDGWIMMHRAVVAHLADVKTAVAHPVSLTNFTVLLRVFESEARVVDLLCKGNDARAKELAVVSGRAAALMRDLDKVETELEALNETNAKLSSELQAASTARTGLSSAAARAAAEGERLAAAAEGIVSALQRGVSSWMSTPETYEPQRARAREALRELGEQLAAAQAGDGDGGSPPGAPSAAVLPPGLAAAMSHLADAVVIGLDDADAWAGCFALDAARVRQLLGGSPVSPKSSAVSLMSRKESGTTRKERRAATVAAAGGAAEDHRQKSSASLSSSRSGVGGDVQFGLRLKVADALRESRGMPTLMSLFDPPETVLPPTPLPLPPPSPPERPKSSTRFTQCELIGGKLSASAPPPAAQLPDDGPASAAAQLPGSSNGATVSSPRSPATSGKQKGTRTSGRGRKKPTVSGGGASSTKRSTVSEKVVPAATSPTTDGSPLVAPRTDLTQPLEMSPEPVRPAAPPQTTSTAVQTAAWRPAAASMPPQVRAVKSVITPAGLYTFAKATQTVAATDADAERRVVGASEVVRARHREEATQACVPQHHKATSTADAAPGGQRRATERERAGPLNESVQRAVAATNTVSWSVLLGHYMARAGPLLRGGGAPGSSQLGASPPCRGGSGSVVASGVSRGGAACAAKEDPDGGAACDSAAALARLVEGLADDSAFVRQLQGSFAVVPLRLDPEHCDISHPQQHQQHQTGLSSGAFARYSVEALQAQAEVAADVDRSSSAPAEPLAPTSPTVIDMQFGGEPAASATPPPHLAVLLSDAGKSNGGGGSRPAQPAAGRRSRLPGGITADANRHTLPLSVLDGEPLPAHLLALHRPRPQSPPQRRVVDLDADADIPPLPNSFASHGPTLGPPPPPQQQQPQHHYHTRDGSPVPRTDASAQLRDGSHAVTVVRRQRRQRRRDEVQKVHRRICETTAASPDAGRALGRDTASPAARRRSLLEPPPAPCVSVQRPASALAMRLIGAPNAFGNGAHAAAPVRRASVRDVVRDVCGPASRLHEALQQATAGADNRDGQRECSGAATSPPPPPPRPASAPNPSRLVPSPRPWSGADELPVSAMTREELRQLGIVHLPAEVAAALQISD